MAPRAICWQSLAGVRWQLTKQHTTQPVMDIDDIFKLPPLPKGVKRKFEAPTHEVPDLNSVKLAPAGSASSVIIEDVDDVDDGGEFAPNGDADYFAEEDEDGRFFGGGLNDVQKQVVSLLEHDEAANDGQLTAQSIKKQLLALEKAINKNRDDRTKFGSDPSKFVDSEFALLSAIQGLIVFNSVPRLSYPLLLSHSTPTSLADLLSHENSDIAIAVVEVLEEWLDEEVLEVDEDEEEGGADNEEEEDGRREAMKSLVEGLVEAGVIEIAVAGLDRLNEQDESERGGVYHTLGLVENLLSLLPSHATPLLSPKSPLLSFLLKRLGMDKQSTELDQNRWYAAELLGFILGLPVDGVEDAKKRLIGEGAVDALLKVLSGYRRRDPSSPDEEEFMENLFLCQLVLLSSAVGQAAFREGEGIELMVLILKEKKQAKAGAIKALDYALQGSGGRESCAHFVEAGGLASLFASFMGKASAKKSKKAAGQTHTEMEHTLSIIASLFTSLESDSPPRLRLLTKFVENEYEKVDRLVELRAELQARMERAEREAEEEEDDEDDTYLRKLESGLGGLQHVDYVLGWVCMEDDGVRDHAKMLLGRVDSSLTEVVKVLDEYGAHVGDALQEEDAEEEDDEARVRRDEADEKREILAALIEYLSDVA